MADIKIAVATPAFGEIFYTPYVQSMLRLQRTLTQRKWELTHVTISYSEISEARNYLLTHWFDKTDASHILFVDADMGFDAQLIVDMIALDKPVVGVVYPKRRVRLTRVAQFAAKGEPPERAIAKAHDFIIRPIRGRQPRQLDGFIEVAGCGAGILLLQRACIATMLKSLPDINDVGAKKTSPLAKNLDRLIRAFDMITVDGVRLSEDFAFCHRWQKLCGGEIWASTNQSVIHIGLHRYTSRYSDVGPVGPRLVVSMGEPQQIARDATALPKNQRRDGRNGKSARPPASRDPRPDKTGRS